jgi:hypothetical protein
MSVKSALAKLYATWRCNVLDRQSKQAESIQKATLLHNVHKARNTRFGQTHDFVGIQSIRDYQDRVPVRNYEGLKPWIDRVQAGSVNELWPGLPNYLSKTSGTTSGTKYIPNTPALLKAHIAGARDALLFYIRESGNADFLNGSMIFLSGSPELEYNAAGIPIGRLSGIVNHFIPAYLKRNQIPSWKTNCIEDWEAKVHEIVNESHAADMRLVSGIPPWVQMYFEALHKTKGKMPAEAWPNLSVFVYGGVDYEPYRKIFSRYLPAQVDLVETYPASEGFIAIQDNLQGLGMRLMSGYGIFYEFIPMDQYGKPDAPRLHIGEVQLNTQYALVLSNPAGLWAYDIGDTVRFTSLNPHRIKVTGRTAQFISAFGEHVIVEEINNSIAEAVEKCPSVVQEFTVMPRVSAQGSGHEWYIEFDQMPASISDFRNALEAALQKQNRYYDDLIKGAVLQPLQIYVLHPGACRAYMKSMGKLGGQNKFPRVKNDDSMRAALQALLDS